MPEKAKPEVFICIRFARLLKLNVKGMVGFILAMFRKVSRFLYLKADNGAALLADPY